MTLKPDMRQLRMIPNPLYCETCEGRRYVVMDAEWQPYAVQCPDCRGRPTDDEQNAMTDRQIEKLVLDWLRDEDCCFAHEACTSMPCTCAEKIVEIVRAALSATKSEP